MEAEEPIPMFGQPEALMHFLKAAGRGEVNGDYNWPQLRLACRWAVERIEEAEHAEMEHEHLGCHIAKTGIYASSAALAQGTPRTDALALRSLNSMDPMEMLADVVTLCRELELELAALRARGAKP
jgi:hypothetical protein